MTPFRPPSTTVATIDDFRRCAWRPSEDSETSYFGWWNSLSGKGFEATQARELGAAKVLWLLADACSMRFEPSNINEPFIATQVDEFKNPRGLDSFESSDIELLMRIYPEVEYPRLRARLADIVWLATRPKRERNAALAAIDAYRATPLTTEDWYTDGQNCWRRGIMLARQLRLAAEPRAAEMAAALQAAVEAALVETKPTNAGISMARALLELDVVRPSYVHLADMLNAKGEHLAAESKFFYARNCFTVAREFFSASQNDERRADMACAVARTYVGEANQRTLCDSPSFSAAVDHYADAIQAYRSVPKQLRSTRGVDVEVKRLYGLLREAGERSLDEFGTFSIEPLDISDQVQSAEDAVTGQDYIEALYRLATCCALVSKDGARAQAKAVMAQSFFGRVFGTQQTATDGRVVDKAPAARDLDDGSEQTEAALWAEMVREHQFHMRFMVMSAIAPTLQTLIREHLVNEDDLRNIVIQSGIVAHDRVMLVTKGLKAGFEGDFSVALHLLVPQLEHIVRRQLKNKSIKTTTLSANGIQMEVGLSTLAAMPEMEDIFGTDLTFELQAAFCEQFGPNLRNDLAHGLLSEGATASAESVYAWWLVFRMVFLNYWTKPATKAGLVN